jgi:pimeloyl-ACP methyl ester carboxylesterase
MQLSKIRIGDDAFYHFDVGAGRPVVFVHGALGDLRTWDDVIAPLSGRFRCIAYTQRGFSRQAWRADGPTFGPATHAADLCAFIRAMGLGPVAVVAWSYGSHVVLKALQQEPALFERALVYDAGVPALVTDAEQAAAMHADMQRIFPSVIAALAEGDLGETVRRLVDASGGPNHFDRQPAYRRTVHIDSAAAIPRLIDSDARAAGPFPGDLRAMRVPVSVTWGEASHALFTAPSKAAAAALTAARHREIAGAGHLWPETDPAGFAELVTEWMDGRLDLPNP